MLICISLGLLAAAPNLASLAASLFLFGASLGLMNCAMNMQGVAVEQESGRAMMSSFHAFFSVGGMLGAIVVMTLLWI